ncbi:MAG: sulfite exporter TauE/SafE family protein [Candidatus Omnitrophica bacterium]|nr:sulfite exporter TauE/SafE family protein [Candidatus Omnitrophota bacterium]MBU1047272.1 sulfite exporter TauE/SafE family protein [Candidatus Omnitrophota bacterium]MBU1630996.1 sulfite exporter TauE/SafE family protein [Candidatus Omnitrophota bacterium]MBU1889143.1 sulfite exporter TauE/SafE family protein [Candidatus Omnitrophota bacterium]
MTPELTVLVITAASIGFFHTLFGPDHYLPFIVMAQARKWSLPKTSLITFLCGLGHVGSSVLLGMVGIALGVAVGKLEFIESFRGNIAAWMFIAFGLVYFVWGLRQAIRNKPHTHMHLHSDGDSHTHEHKHQTEHLHPHEKTKAVNITPWIIFTIFVFGPCEPLIPILMYPAAKSSIFGMVLVASVFSAVTIATMVSIVLVSTFGVNFLPMKKLERYNHALAGAVILMCGVAIQFLGL